VNKNHTVVLDLPGDMTIEDFIGLLNGYSAACGVRKMFPQKWPGAMGQVEGVLQVPMNNVIHAEIHWSAGGGIEVALRAMVDIEAATRLSEAIAEKATKQPLF